MRSARVRALMSSLCMNPSEQSPIASLPLPHAPCLDSLVDRKAQVLVFSHSQPPKIAINRCGADLVLISPARDLSFGKEKVTAAKVNEQQHTPNLGVHMALPIIFAAPTCPAADFIKCQGFL